MTAQKITPDMVLAKLTDKPKIQAEIARELECYRSTPAKHLKRLEADGKVKKTETGWIRTGREAQQVEDDGTVEYIIEDMPSFIDWLVERDVECECDLIHTDDDIIIAHEESILGCLAELAAHTTTNPCDVVAIVQRIEAHKKARDWLQIYHDAACTYDTEE